MLRLSLLGAPLVASAFACAAVEPLAESDCPVGARASIRGQVLSEGGEPVANANVVIDPGTDYTAQFTADSRGFFQFPCVPPGPGYRVQASAPGFTPSSWIQVRPRVPVADVRVVLVSAAQR